jgi:hypothetical protein
MAIQWRTTSWCGTRSEQDDLLRAIQHNCRCVYVQGACTSACASHRMLVEDQRTLDRLLFMRRIADRLRLEESMARP